ncbi:hypothetical protein CTAYLR_007216 [Chrysophaeum taylorii]|uniref:Cytochrome b5 heme-binding domain-containing protein n=1 Tax=Chrysophaeum taylorii TaxID=2483200 RepID=A0AAD7XJ46_9STRA|nr:hypothetical protein CTAYLR_007216 [Chrysophaeum taylorii]
MSLPKPVLITATMGLVSRTGGDIDKPPVEERSATCDACPFCDDVCGDPACAACAAKKTTRRTRYTMCEVRRHTTVDSCWLVAGTTVYDVTSFLRRHPAGTMSIVRHAGGRDCAEDFSFHSAKAQKLWANHKIGRLVRCPSEKSSPSFCLIS